MKRGTIAGQVMTKQGNPIADAAVLITGDSPEHKDKTTRVNIDLANSNSELSRDGQHRALWRLHKTSAS